MALTQPPSFCSFLQRCQEEWSGSGISPLSLKKAQRAGPAAGAGLAAAGQSRAGLGWVGQRARCPHAVPAARGRRPRRPKAALDPPAADGARGAAGSRDTARRCRGESRGTGAAEGGPRDPAGGVRRSRGPGPCGAAAAGKDGRRGGRGAGARRGTLPDGEGAQGLLRPFLTPLREEAALSSTGAAFPRQLVPAGQRRLPLQLWGLLVPSEKRGAERERTAEDAVPHGSLPVAAGAVQPGHREVSFSLLRVLRLGGL